MSDDQIAALEKEIKAVDKEINGLLARKRKAQEKVDAVNAELRPLRTDLGNLTEQLRVLLPEDPNTQALGG